MMLKIFLETLGEQLRPLERVFSRRTTAWLLVLTLCLGVLPLDASAAKVKKKKTTEAERQAKQEEQARQAAEQLQLSRENWQPLQRAQSPVSAGKAMENTYILELSSGTRQGGSTTDNIVYFSVWYTDTHGVKRSNIIMPREDAQQKSLQTANEQGNRDARRQDVLDMFGYTTETLLDRKALGNVQTDQLLFTTTDPVRSIDKIQIFGRDTLAGSNWSCQGMRVYRVDTLYGLEMYGWFSDWSYIDFAGELVAEVIMRDGAGTFQWNVSGGVYNIVGPGERGGVAGCTLVTKDTASSYNGKTHIGYSHGSQTGNTVVFRIDLADLGDAGLETLAGSYEAGKESKVSSLAYCECAALIVRYYDIYGCIREIALPVAINAIGQLAEIEKDPAVAGYAQQGDTIAFTAMLPDFESVQSAFLTLGEPGAVGAAHLVDAGLVNVRTETGFVKVASGNLLNGPQLGLDYSIRPALAPNSLELAVAGSNTVTTQTPGLYGAAACWKISDAGDGYYYIVNSANGQVLSTSGSAGAFPMLVNRSNLDTQKWKFEDAGDGCYWLSPMLNSAIVLDVLAGSIELGTRIQVWKRNGNVAQKFKFVRTDSMIQQTEDQTFPVVPLEEGNYIFVNKYWSERGYPLLSVPGTIGNSTKSMVSAGGENYEKGEVEPYQAWHVTSAGDGYYYILPLANEGYALDAAGGALNEKAIAHLWAKTANITQQRWRIRSAGNGYYLIVSEKFPRSGLWAVDQNNVVSTRFSEQPVEHFDEMCWKILPASASFGGKPGVAPKGDADSVLTGSKKLVRDRRIASSESDTLRYLCFAVYQGADVSVRVHGATVQYDFGSAVPIQYTAATTNDGISVPTGARERLSLKNVTEDTRVVLHPADRTDQYLVTICTDSVSNSGTVDNLKVMFHYENMKDEDVSSPLYDARDFIKRYYGEWPGNVPDFAYKYGLRDEGVVQLIVPLSNVNKFTGISFKLEGNDEWQYSGLQIAKIAKNGISARLAAWQEINASNGPIELRSHLHYSRDVQTDSPCFTLGKIYKEGEERPKPDPTQLNEDGTLKDDQGMLIQNDGEVHQFNKEGTQVDEREEADWSKLRSYMTLDDAKKGLGFVKRRAEYTVSVKVANDKVNALDDDCGSKNLFYFRLLFENGSSACTLANQQMVGDAFHTGSIAQFKIYANQDYGEVQAVQIIPDDQDGNGDIYDKLKIDSISVVLEGNKAISPTWEAKSDSEDGLGWVGIDFRDQGEMASNRGAAGRSISELATTYPITGKTYSAKLLVSIATAPYETRTLVYDDGTAKSVPRPTFTGGVRMEYNYYDLNGNSQPERNVDVVALMDAYAGRTSNYVRSYVIDGEEKTAEVSYAVSDPAYLFRAGTVDHFFLTVKDISELIDMKLYIQSDVVTNWTISNVSVSLVNGTGTRYLNARGEYDYRYEEGQKPVKITEWDNVENLSRELVVYEGSKDYNAQDIPIQFKRNAIQISENGDRWTSVISREPTTSDDTLNLYLYPSMAENAEDPNSYDLECVVNYTEKENEYPMQISAGLLKHAADSSGRVVMYANGLNVANMLGFQGVDVKTAAVRTINAPIDYGILQRVRGGVLIESYQLSSVANADSDYAVTMSASADRTKTATQRLMIQFDPAMEKQVLEKEKTDLAVALYFTTDNPEARELRSKYVYLTDTGVTEIEPGHVYEIDFALGDIADIAALNIVAIGGLNAPVRAVYLANQRLDGEALQTWGIAQPFAPTVKPQRIEFNGNVGFMTLKLKTAEDDGTVSSGTAGPVRMTVGYYDDMGYLSTEHTQFDDVRSLLEDGGKFTAGSTNTIRLLIPNCTEIRWVDLEPWHDEGSTNAEWRLAQVEARLGVGSHIVTRTIDKAIPEGAPRNIMLAEVLVTGTVQHLLSDGKVAPMIATTTETDGTTAETDGTSAATDAKNEGTDVFTGTSLSVMTESGDGVKVSVRVSGSTEGYTATVQAFDPATKATGPASMSPTHRYTDAKLAELIEKAQGVIEAAKKPNLTSADGSFTYSAEVAQAIADEADAAKSVLEYAQAMQNAGGRLVNKDGVITFYAPRNYTGAALHYRLIVASKEAPSVSFSVDVTVKSELELLTDAVSEFKTAQSNTLHLKENETSAEASNQKADESKPAAGAPTQNETERG